MRIVMTYRRKPLVFEAVQWSDLPGVHETVYAWMKASGQAHRYEVTTGILRFTCKEGGTGVKPGDWLVKDDEGEVYPVLDRRFRKLYVPVGDTPHFFRVGDGVRIVETGTTCRIVGFADDDPTVAIVERFEPGANRAPCKVEDLVFVRPASEPTTRR